MFYLQTLSSWMPMVCLQTLHQSPLSGSHDRGKAAGNKGRELASSSDWDAVFSDLLSQPFCWLTFSHWTTNSVNCGRSSHSNEKQGMSAMVPDSAIELKGFSVHLSDRTKELTGKSRGGGICFYINNSWCDERNIHSIQFFCSLIWNFICFCVDHSGYRGNLQRS